MFASDPLSLLFLGSALFSGLFLVASVLLGAGHGHMGHLGGHAVGGAHLGSPAGHGGHVGATGHAGIASHTGHVGHIGPAESHAPATRGDVRAGSAVNGAQGSPSVWVALNGLLLGSLNLNGALIFLLVFGVLGYLLHTGQALSTLTAVLISAFVGAVAAIGVNAALTRLFITSQAGELSPDSSRLDGRMGTVSLAIRANGLGEVIYTGEAGARQSLGARSADGSAIEAGTQVVIVGSAQGLATVQPWDHFLADTRQRLIGDAEPTAPTSLEHAAPPGMETPTGE